MKPVNAGCRRLIDSHSVITGYSGVPNAVRIDTHSLIGGRRCVDAAPVRVNAETLVTPVTCHCDSAGEQPTVRKTRRTFIGFSFRRSVRRGDFAVRAIHTFDTGASPG